MRRILLTCASAALLFGTACSRQETFKDATPVKFTITEEGSGTRAAVNYAADDYFGLSGMADASVTVGGKTVKFTYEAGELSAASENDLLFFPVDGSNIPSIKVAWPEAGTRTAQGSGIPKNQTTKEVFLACDWLSAELTNVASAESIPVTLSNERSKITFTLTGSTAGSKISSLTIAGYSAYCDSDAGVKDAQLIMLPGNADIVPESVGVVGIDGASTLKNFIIRTMPVLVAGENHTIEINL